MSKPTTARTDLTAVFNDISFLGDRLSGLGDPATTGTQVAGPEGNHCCRDLRKTGVGGP